MELKTIKEFCHKNNLGEGLEYKNGKFQVNIDNEYETKAIEIDERVTDLEGTIDVLLGGV